MNRVLNGCSRECEGLKGFSIYVKIYIINTSAMIARDVGFLGHRQFPTDITLCLVQVVCDVFLSVVVTFVVSYCFFATFN